MRATLRDAKEKLRRPKNLAALSGVALIVTAAVYLFGYVPTRRFAIPTLIFIGGYMAWRVGAKRLRVSATAGVVRACGVFNMGLAVYLLLGAAIDNIFFADMPQLVFAGLVFREVFINFQLSRLDDRLTLLSDEDISVITQSSDVAIARLNNEAMESKAVLKDYAVLRERLGLSADKYLRVQH